MSRTLDPSQRERAQAGELVPVDLVRMTTYTDQPAGTVGTVFYFSEHATLYDFADEGTNREHWPVLIEVNPGSFSMPHVPSPSDGTIITRRCEVRLSNITQVIGQTMAEHFESVNLTGAKIEWRHLLLEASDLTVPRLDLSNLTGAEATAFFEGEVRNVSLDEREVVLDCETSIVPYDWPIEVGSTVGFTDTRDIGVRLPIVIGEQRLQKAINHRVGARTTLRVPLEENVTSNIEVSDTSGFSTGPAFAIIGLEKVGYTVIDSKTMQINGRGNNGTPNQNHAAGEQMTEEPGQTEFIFAANACTAVTQVYAKNSQGNLVAFDFGTIEVDNTTIIGGQTVCVLKLDRAQLRSLAFLMQQSLDNSAGEIGTSTTSFNHSTDSTITASTWLANGANRTSATSMAGTGNAGDDDAIRYTYPLTGGGDGLKKVIQWRYIVPNVSAFVNQTSQGLGVAMGLYARVSSTHSDPVPEKNLGAIDDLLFQFSSRSTTQNKTNLQSNWAIMQTTPLPTLNDIMGEGITIDWGMGQGGGLTLAANALMTLANGIDIEFELEEVQSLATDVTITTGWDLELYADMFGAPVPTGATPAYKSGLPGSAITRPCDAMRWVIEELLGGAIDTASYDECDTNLGELSIGTDLRGLGVSALEALGRLAFESRTNLVAEATQTGTQWKMLTATSAYGYGTAEGSIDDWGPDGYSERTLSPAGELANHFIGFYNYNPFLGNTDAAFEAEKVANPTTSDVPVPTAATLAAREDAQGTLFSEPYFFLCIKASDTMDDVFGFYCSERSRGPRMIFVDGVPWWDAYDLEPGDIRNVTAPWSVAPRKVRILSVQRDSNSELTRVGAVEVD